MLERIRRAAPALDHLIRAYQRYSNAGGSRLAASVTLPGFLAFFPLLALSFFVLTTVLHGSASAQRSVLDAVHGYLPGLLCSSSIPGYPCSGKSTIDVASISPKSSAGVVSGIIGLVGLALAGTGWVDALRANIRTVWNQDVNGGGNILVKKLFDLFTLVVLGVIMLASLGIGGLATSATDGVISTVGLSGNVLANVATKVVGVGLSIGVNALIFLFLFTRLTDLTPALPSARMLRGCLFGGGLLSVLQIVGATYLNHTTSNAVYGVFAAVIGLALWIGLVSQLTLFTAAWVVTGPYLDDVLPSGSADDPELPPRPLGPAIGPLVRGMPAVQAPGYAAPGIPLPDAAPAARVAGVAGVGVLALTAAGVAAYGVRTLRDAVR